MLLLLGVSLNPIHTIASPLSWVAFILVVLALLALDLGLLQRKAVEVSPRRAALWSAVWVALSVAFGAGIAVVEGRRVALEFAAGYVLEKALAVDNLFVIALLFAHFRIPARYQHRVLYWGILGALVMRGIFVGLGTALINRFDWVLYVFGGLLVVAGIHIAFQQESQKHPEGLIVRAVRRLIPVTRHLRSAAFFVVERKKLKATPLLLAVITIEVSDVAFAVDSIPAVFAVTRDPFIVFTSNICAVLGMRSLYFLLAHVMDRFAYLKYGLAAVLCFVGARLLLHHVIDIPVLVSLAVILGVVALSMLFSWFESSPPARRGNLSRREAQRTPS